MVFRGRGRDHDGGGLLRRVRGLEVLVPLHFFNFLFAFPPQADSAPPLDNPPDPVHKRLAQHDQAGAEANGDRDFPAIVSKNAISLALWPVELGVVMLGLLLEI